MKHIYKCTLHVPLILSSRVYTTTLWSASPEGAGCGQHWHRGRSVDLIQTQTAQFPQPLPHSALTL